MLSPQQAKIIFLFNLNITTYQRCVPFTIQVETHLFPIQQKTLEGNKTEWQV